MSMTLCFSSPVGFKNYLHDFKWGAVPHIWRIVKIVSVLITLSLLSAWLTLALFIYISFCCALPHENVTVLTYVNISLRKTCLNHSNKTSAPFYLATTTPLIPSPTIWQKNNKRNSTVCFSTDSLCLLGKWLLPGHFKQGCLITSKGLWQFFLFKSLHP